MLPSGCVGKYVVGIAPGERENDPVFSPVLERVNEKAEKSKEGVPPASVAEAIVQVPTILSFNVKELGESLPPPQDQIVARIATSRMLMECLMNFMINVICFVGSNK